MATKFEPTSAQRLPAAPVRATTAGAQGVSSSQQAMASKARNGESYDEDEEGEEGFEEGGGTFLLMNAMPSWLTSLVFHVVFLLIFAMIMLPEKPEPPKATVEIGNSDESNELEEPPIDEPIENMTDEPTSIEPQPETDNIAEEPVISPAADPDAAPASVELDMLGERQAPSSDLLKKIGTVTGTGLEGRGAAARSHLARSGGATKGSEEAVDRALRWFAAHQNPDGSWSFDHRRGPCQNRCPNQGNLADARMAATGMALLPFLGRGETHMEGRYKKTVKDGLAYLLRNMKVQGDRGDMAESGATQYGHGICSIVLCEAYAMTNDRALMQPAQMAVNQIVFNQDPEGGGWRYTSKQPGDTSVVGWQLMALKSAHMAYLNVPPPTIAGANKFLDSVQSESGAYYGYTSPGTGLGTTSVGLLCRMYLGWKKDNGALQRGVEILGNEGPSQGNMYYNYYATQIMRHVDGEPWKKWNGVMRDQLVNSQSRQGHTEGSWYTDAGGDHGTARGGRVYVTSMATMILEVYYRHMPLYRQQAAEEEFPL